VAQQPRFMITKACKIISVINHCRNFWW